MMRRGEKIDVSILGHQHLALVAVLALGNNPFAEQLRQGLFGLDQVKQTFLWMASCRAALCFRRESSVYYSLWSIRC